MALPEPSYDDILKSLNSVDPYVHAFLERARKGTTSKKEVLLDIHQYYFGGDEQPTLRDADVAMLLSGIIAISSRRKRRIGIKMKEVAGMALKLMRKFLDEEFNASNAEQFLRVLRMTPVATLARMRLDKHILADKGNSADALWIASKLHKTVPLMAIMENAVARSRFRTYIAAHPGEDGGDSSDAEDIRGGVRERTESSGPPTTWVEETEAAPLAAGFDATPFPTCTPSGMPAPVLDAGGMNEEHVEPLGLMRLDMDLLYRLRRASSMQDGARDGARGGGTGGGTTTARITLLSDQFDPELFLSIFHRHTPFETLQSSMSKLQEEMDAQEEMRVAQLKDHFDRFINAQEVVRELQHSIESDNVTGRGSMLVSARKALGEVELSAGMLFQPVLERKQQADRIRSVLEVLKRFHTLFHVPGTISDSIANGSYESVLRDYKNARVLIGSSKNAIFQQLWAEVEQRIQTLRAHLLGVLEDPQVHVEEQERVIGVLRQLASDGDPAFHYLSQQHARMLERMDAIVAEMHSTSAAGIEPGGDTAAAVLSSAAGDAFVFPSSVSSLGGSEAGDADTMLAAHWGRCVKKLTAGVRRSVPSWWKVSRKLCDTPQTRGMLKTTLQSYASKVRDAIELVGEDSVMFVVMQDIVMEVTQCMHTLEPVQLPVACITVVRSLVTHANTSYFTQAFRSIMMEARGLVDEEDWNTDRSVHEVTGLCERFRSSLEAAVLEMGRVLHKGSNVFSLVAPIFRDCLLVFTDSLHHLAFRTPSRGAARAVDSDSEDGSDYSSEDGSTAAMGVRARGEWSPFVPPLSRRLLLVYNNTVHYSSHTVHVLVDTLVRVARAKHAPASLTTDLATVHAACEHLCVLVTNRYLAEHTVKARAVVRRGMRLSGVDYARTARPSELSAWVNELLRLLVLVHAELHTTTPELLPRVLSAVVEGVLQQVLACAEEVRAWSKWGVVLLDAEVTVLERVLAAQLNKRSKRSARAVHAMLRKRHDLSDVDKARGEKLLTAALSHHALMYACFS